jgi:hypothetical protein
VVNRVPYVDISVEINSKFDRNDELMLKPKRNIIDQIYNDKAFYSTAQS